MLTFRTISFGPGDYKAHRAFLLQQAKICWGFLPSEDNHPMWTALLDWAALEYHG